MSDETHTFRFGLNDNKCQKCNLDFDKARKKPCKPGVSFEDLMCNFYEELQLEIKKPAWIRANSRTLIINTTLTRK